MKQGTKDLRPQIRSAGRFGHRRRDEMARGKFHGLMQVKRSAGGATQLLAA